MRPTLFDFTGYAAIVTGGGSGIGEVTAMMLARAGADIAIAGRKSAPLEAAAENIRAETGRTCLAIPADVRIPEQAQALVEKAVAGLGRLDLLINNAGKGYHAPLHAMKVENWNNDVALNLSAAFVCAQAALPHLIASGRGAVVNISSLAGVNGTMGVGAYSAAKAGLQMFTRVSAAEWGPRGVRVNCVAPGMIATELAKAGWAKTGFDAGKACEAFPLRRPGRPEEVANAVLFLASESASYITGETLTVGGGPQLKGMIDV